MTFKIKFYATLLKLHEQKRDLVLKALKTQRKIALKAASQDRLVKMQIMNLNKILQRKRKTVSLVQLKDKVIFEKLLSVFPCWIMSIEDVARIFPLQVGLFDYLIVDEASQCNQATTLHLAYRAKKMVVVGDEKQMNNPNLRFLSNDLVRMLLDKHGISSHPKAEFLNAKESLLSLSKYSSNCEEFLNEHFRCEPPIIAWSNKNFYDNQLRVLTPIRRKRFVPCMEVHLVRGADDDPDSKQNVLEAEAAINEMIRLIDSGEAEGLSIGVMSLYREQSNLLQSLMYEKLEDKPHLIKEYKLIASTADGFQGDERDIIIYSLRFGPSSSPGVINAIQNEPERINVAFSRARRKIICFISRPVEEFPRGLVKDFLKQAEMEHKQPVERLNITNEDIFHSEFEKHVCYNLRQRGLTVYTQVPCASFSIDMIVIDKQGRRMAIECDGDFHYEEDGELRAEDYQRQDIIIRNGWYVHRVPASRYYTNPEASINLLLEDLERQQSDDEVFDAGNLNQELFVPQAVSETDEESFIKKEKFPETYEELNVLGAEERIFITSEGEKDNNNSFVKDEETYYEQEDSPLILNPEKDNVDKTNEHVKIDINKEPLWEKTVWFALSRWGKEKGFPGKYNAFCYNIGIYLGRGYKLTEKQVNFAKIIWEKAIESGFKPNV